MWELRGLVDVDPNAVGHVFGQLVTDRPIVVGEGLQKRGIPRAFDDDERAALEGLFATAVEAHRLLE